jgi:hypothetical protein
MLMGPLGKETLRDYASTDNTDNTDTSTGYCTHGQLSPLQ